MTTAEHVQRDQPDGVPPLELTGERTLPDVPAENYWYRRHLAVYEWIARRCGGLDVVDLACGEGYGTDVLARHAANVTGVDANPEAHEHARLKYTRPGVRFVRDLVESFDEPVDAVVFLQTIEHVENPGALLDGFRRILRPGGTAYVSTPNVLTLAPKGAERSGNPWHVHEYKAEEYRELCEASFDSVELIGLFHARKLRDPRARAQARLGLGARPPRSDRALLRPLHSGDRRERFRASSGAGPARPRARLPRHIAMSAIAGELRPPPARPERPQVFAPASLHEPPRPPELPETLGRPPNWPWWYGPVALVVSFVVIALAIIPFIPWAYVGGQSLTDAGDADATFLLVGIVVQDGVWVTLALLFALIKLRPRAWQFGLRPARLKRAVGWATLAFLLLYAFEFGYLELLNVDESNVEDLGADAGAWEQIATALAVIVIAPITEEFFFRGFFYRALRNRMRWWWAALLNGVIFGALHYEGYDTLLLLPVIAVFGFTMCLVYERTGTIFATIAVHAAFNTVANALSGGGVLTSILIGVVVVSGCFFVPWRMQQQPTPFRGLAGARSRLTGSELPARAG